MSQKPRGPLSPFARFLLMAFITLCMVFTSGVAALRVYPGLALLPVVNRVETSPYCPVWRSVVDAQMKIDQAASETEIRAQSHVVRKDGSYKLWSTPAGEYWVPDTSDDILSILLAQQKRKIYGNAATGGVRKGDIVLDGGAHIGTYVKTALDAGAEKIVAVEPSPEALECLRRNFAKEIAAGRVIVYPKGIWDEEKHLVFYANGNGAAGDSFVSKAADARVIADIPVTTVDKIVKELNLPRVDIIKADIKGAGTRMIKGGVETIRAYHPRIVISVEEEPENPVEIHDAVMKIAPNYHFRAGPCEFGDGEIRNDTIFFE
ncbi:MAG: FkbM family methyltransferase [Acidobacteriota bacterium]